MILSKSSCDSAGCTGREITSSAAFSASGMSLVVAQLVGVEGLLVDRDGVVDAAADVVGVQVIDEIIAAAIGDANGVLMIDVRASLWRDRRDDALQMLAQIVGVFDRARR